VTDTTRKLATIVALDVAGYSARTEADEARTTAEVAALRTVIEAIATKRGGRLFNTAGDGFMLEFGSSLAAVEAAFELAETCEPKVRVGVHLGDVVVQPNGDLLGHGVNVAARLMAKSEPGGALVSGAVRQSIRGPVAERLVSRGSMQLDKMAEVIEAFAIGVSATSTAATPKPVALALPEKPSIAVLPFSDMTGAKDQDYFTEGMLVEIVTALSAFPSLFVIAHAASLSLRGDTRSHTLIARELGVRYILSGSVRKSGDRVRISVELLDEGARTPIWTQRFDGTLEDVFALQDTVANAVASQIEPSIQAAEVRRATTRPTADPGAYDLYLRGLHAQWGAYEKAPLQTALGFFEQAIERDPDFGLALAHASNAHVNMYLQSESDHPEVSRQKAYELAKRAERLGTNDAEVLAFAAYSLLQCGADMPIVDALITRALEMSPGSSVVRYNSGWIYAFACRPEAALAEFEQGLRLDPRSPWWAALALGKGWSLFHLRRFAEALPLIYKTLDLAQPNLARKLIASCHGHLGRYDEARTVLQGVEHNTPKEALWLSLYRDKSFRAVLDEGLARVAAGATTT
jgi:adenylate cyclase